MKLSLRKQSLKKLSDNKSVDKKATPQVAGGGLTVFCPPDNAETTNYFQACICDM